MGNIRIFICSGHHRPWCCAFRWPLTADPSTLGGWLPCGSQPVQYWGRWGSVWQSWSVPHNLLCCFYRLGVRASRWGPRSYQMEVCSLLVHPQWRLFLPCSEPIYICIMRVSNIPSINLQPFTASLSVEAHKLSLYSNLSKNECLL